jgi:hypothetical protein
METMVFATPVRLDSLYFGVQKALNMGLESIKNLLNIRLVLEEINPAKTRMIINKANIVFVPPLKKHVPDPKHQYVLTQEAW